MLRSTLFCPRYYNTTYYLVLVLDQSENDKPDLFEVACLSALCLCINLSRLWLLSAFKSLPTFKFHLARNLDIFDVKPRPSEPFSNSRPFLHNHEILI